jgi:dolichol-phosphate mannosyltransferase
MAGSTLIVVPTFNEADNVARLVEGIRAVLPLAHVLVVDDASPDGTGAIARQLARGNPQLHVLERAAKLGLGTAYVAGFAWGLERGFERFFEMDADFSHDPAYLPSFVAALDDGADVVVGSRGVPGGRVEGWGPVRHLLSRGGSWYARRILGVGVRDMTSGFKAYSRRALELLEIAEIRSNGYAFQVETTYRALQRGLQVRETPIVFVDRRVGASKMSLREVWDAVWDVWRIRGA